MRRAIPEILKQREILQTSTPWKMFHFVGETGSICFDEVKLIWLCASLLAYPVGAVFFV
jgi:hypothetical protein